MSVADLSLAFAASLAGSGVITLALRRWFSRPESCPLVFETSAAQTKHGWASFWARDPFVQAHRDRKGFAFGTYAVPGGESIATHFAASDVHQHNLILGATGTGKSSLLELMARHHLQEQRPFALFDLHGDLFSRVAGWALVTKPKRLVLLDFTRPDLLPTWNPLLPLPGVDAGRQVDMLVSVFKRLYADEIAASWAWGPKIEELTRHALRACIESAAPMSLVDLPSFFLVPAVRQRVVATASPRTQQFFAKQFRKNEERYDSAVLNKFEPFLGSAAVQRFLGAPSSSFDLLGAMDRGDTILVNLPRGYMGVTADVMGRLLVSVLQLAALRRERMSPAKRKPYSLLMDEAHVLSGNESGLEEFLIAGRKYRVYATLAAQALSLFRPQSRPQLLGNTSGQFFFRLPYAEARALAPDVLEPLGSIWREQERPNESIDDPLLTPPEEMAWRTKELASLPIGACYWLRKGRPYKGRRIRVLPPLDLPFSDAELRRRIDRAMAAQKGLPMTGKPEEENDLRRAFAAAIAERSERRMRAAGISEPVPPPQDAAA
jgi:Helicase HerA, central domain